jgi:hypothetical protein
MTRVKLSERTSEQLLERFAAIGLQQDEALLWGKIGNFNALFRELVAIEDELKSRPGDQRRMLTALYRHDNAQVRLNAAKATLAVSPDAARLQLETIANSRRYPQAGDAGMSLDALDRGIFKPT